MYIFIEIQTVRFSDILKCFNKGGGIKTIGSQSFFLFKKVHLIKRGHVP